MKRMKNILILMAFCLLGTGCSFLDVEPQIIVADTFYDSEDRAFLGLVGVYGGLARISTYGHHYSLELSNVDDLCYHRNYSATPAQIYFLGHNAGNSNINEAWNGLYAIINIANSFMEAMEELDYEYDPDHLYTNEARFIRAYVHWLLAEGWGDIPLRDKAVTDAYNVSCPATPQYDVLKWCVSEMEACLDLADVAWEAPSRVNKTIMWGILSRVYLFMAGETVSGNEAYRKDYFLKAMNYAKDVIDSGVHRLNPDYTQVFINMIANQYDTEYKESMWEVEFEGDRSSSDSWSNGYIGSYMGMKSNISEDYYEANCNFSHGWWMGTLQLWNLYWATDRTIDENTTTDVISDIRQDWNMAPYNYNSTSSHAPYPSTASGSCRAGIDKAPYSYNGTTTSQSPVAARAIRSCSKFRREVIYEGISGFKSVATSINYPLLRYSDVLLMYAEAYNEYYGQPDEYAYECVKAVRDRAGIQTRDFSEYASYSAFQSFVRNERGRELVFEGIRRYDLIRWGIYVTEMRKYLEYTADSQWTYTSYAQTGERIGNNVQERHIYFPIPTQELAVNLELQQNVMWQ